MSDRDDDLGDWELVYTRLLRLGTLLWARSVDRYTDYADSAVSAVHLSIVALYAVPPVFATANTLLSIREHLRGDNKVEKDEIMRAAHQVKGSMKAMKNREKIILLLDRNKSLGSPIPADLIPDFDLSEDDPLDALYEVCGPAKNDSCSSRIWSCIKHLVVPALLFFGKIILIWVYWF